ncbi:hypothetical protein GCM10028807_58890 [Spirosoma daeguense]
MKSILIAGVLLVGLSGQAMSMGHPHNVFAARKQLRAKTCVSTSKSKLRAATEWKNAVQATKVAVSERILSVLMNIRPARAY